MVVILIKSWQSGQHSSVDSGKELGVLPLTVLTIDGCWGGGTHFSLQRSHRHVVYNPINSPTPMYMQKRLI